jgi:hypothetical protein
MLARIAAFIALLIVTTASAPGDAVQRQFQVGQKWTIKNSPAAETHIVIGRIEPWHDRTVIHVSIFKIPVPADVKLGRETIEVAHSPFDQQALVESVDRLVASNAAISPEFEGGYAQWKSASGGIYTITVAQSVEVMLEALRGRAN